MVIISIDVSKLIAPSMVSKSNPADNVMQLTFSEGVCIVEREKGINLDFILMIHIPPVFVKINASF